MQHFTRDSLDADGRVFLSDRGISIPVAQQMGVASENGEIAFPYVFNGEIVRVKYRNMQDKKKMRFNSMKEGDKANFKMPFWNQRIWPTSDYLIITEGEFDAIAIAQLGACQVVSLPNGAASVTTTFKNHYDYLQTFTEIYIAFDMDEAGEKAVNEAKKLISPKKFRRIMFPAKDANDWVKDNAGVEKADLDDLMRNAARIYVDEIVHFRDLPETFYHARDKGIPTGWKDLDNLIGGIRPKEMTVISADTGAGKTTFSVNLLCNLIKKHPSGFWINSWEMDYEVIIRKVASIVLGSKFKTQAFTTEQIKAFKAWMQKHNAMINPKRSKADIPTLHKQVEMASKVYGVKYVLLDHLDYISATSKEKEGHEKIKDAIVGIHDMALEFDVHIILIAHPKQLEDGSGKMHMGQLKGSAAIKQYADNILLLQNMAQVDLASPDNRMKVLIPKNRFFGTKGEVTLRYMPESDSYIDNSQVFSTRSSYEEG
jgi:twinkle protein